MCDQALKWRPVTGPALWRCFAGHLNPHRWEAGALKQLAASVPCWQALVMPWNFLGTLPWVPLANASNLVGYHGQSLYQLPGASGFRSRRSAQKVGLLGNRANHIQHADNGFNFLPAACPTCAAGTDVPAQGMVSDQMLPSTPIWPAGLPVGLLWQLLLHLERFWPLREAWRMTSRLIAAATCSVSLRCWAMAFSGAPAPWDETSATNRFN